MNKTELTVLTNDPSLTGWGVAVLKNDAVLFCGCIKTAPEHKKKRIRKTDDDLRRISEIVRSLHDIIKKYNVNYIVSEIPHGSQSASGAVMVGTVRGIIQTMADVLDIPLETYSEQEAKKMVLGKKAATKPEMIAAIKKLHKVPFKNVKYYDEAVADAIAIYHTATLLSPTLKLLK